RGGLFGSRFDEALEGEFYVLGGHRAIAAGENQSRAKPKVNFCIASLFDFFSCIESPFRGTRLEPHQALHAGKQNVHVNRASAVTWIEILQIALDPHHDLRTGT